MEVEIKKLPKSQVELTIELPPLEIEKYLDSAAKNISKETNIPGFRRGYAPKEIVQQHVGKISLWEEAAKLAVRKTYPKAIIDNNIKAIGQPNIQITKLAPENPLVYKAKVAVLPCFTLPDYRKMKVKKRKVEVKPAEVERLIRNLQKSRAKFKKVDRPAKINDAVEIDFKTYLNKVPIDRGESKNHPLILGENKFVPGFEEKLIGMRKGDKKEFTLRFPKDYYQKDLANRDVEFKVEMKSVQERELPKIDDEFAQSLGRFKDLADLKSKLTDNLKQEKEMKEKSRFEMEMLQKIADQTEMEIPEVLIQAEIEKMINELKDMVKASGGEFDKYLKSIKKTEEDLKDEFKDRAKERVKYGLILREIAQKEKIKTDDQEVEQERQRTLAHYQHDKEMMEKIQSEEYKEYIRGLIQNRKVFAFLTKVMEEK